MNLNTQDSTIKFGIDEWYKRYLIPYSNYIEDTIYCNNRLSKNINNVTDELYKVYSEPNDTNLNCIRNSDKFSVSNEYAKLDYPIGLITTPEMNLLNNSIIRKTNNDYWLMSAKNMDSLWGVRNEAIDSNGRFNKYSTVSNNYGIRPAISLKRDIKYVSGTGSKNAPFIIVNKYHINVEIKNETEDFNISIDDLTSVQEGKIIDFKITPIKGYKVNNVRIIDEDNNEIEYTKVDNSDEYNFTMPASDVTIKPSYERVKNAVYVEDNKNTKELIIEVNDVNAVVYEDTVKFTIVPEDGYELEDIDIRDKDNQRIEYTKTNKDNEYKFIMPDTDVVIKPIYRKLANNNENSSNKIIYNILNNPKTGKKLLLFILLIGILFISLKKYYRVNNRN